MQEVLEDACRIRFLLNQGKLNFVNYTFIALEVAVIFVTLATNSLLVIAVRKTSLLNTLVKCLVTNKWIALISYLPTRLFTLAGYLGYELPRLTNMLIIAFHFVCYQTLYTGVPFSAIAVQCFSFGWFRSRQSTVVICIITVVLTWTSAAFLALHPNIDLLGPAFTFYGPLVSIVLSIGICYRVMKMHHKNYRVDAVGNVARKTDVSVNIRSLRLLTTVCLVTTARMLASIIVLYIVFQTLLLQRKDLDNALRLEHFHYIVFEAIEALLALYLIGTEPSLKKAFIQPTRSSGRMQNVLGDQIYTANRSEDHFIQLNGQWQTNNLKSK
ncbi:unnamed protein product [Bursaphelenchus xylophilus]|uniref:(pine wood nematode) hypothetical protein n=1 Tax=Bursaphelenchus xylophilus TaxID=6326 RepID=A0A1I7S2E8_BURXY|nr:unnamed protein product [Bursaphelenchus xylophilus]CAG9114611.1 unnamed protein product [Bursaphelenchus xylophilus]